MASEIRPLKIGLYSPFFGRAYGGGEKYLGVTAEAIRDAFPGHSVEIVSSVPADAGRYEQMLGLDLNRISLRARQLRGTSVGRIIRRIPTLRRYADLYLSARAVSWTREYDLLLSMAYVIPAFCRARRGVILCQFPYELGTSDSGRTGLLKFLYGLYVAPYELLKRKLIGSEAESFHLVICQSEFVRGWIRRYWRRDSLVVHPPVDIPEISVDPESKRPLILSVGRFFASGHCKRQDLMVRVFRQLEEQGLSGWELHLVGSLHRDNAADMRYFARVEELAQGGSVHLHPDAPRSLVEDLYRRASIYWHAAGYGADPERRPVDLEHFGMSTVEAMGHGAVPVAIARGGQVEVVNDSVDGFLWQETGDLIDRTRQLAGDPSLRREMGAAARAASLRFSREEFKLKMAASLAPLIDELASPASAHAPPVGSALAGEDGPPGQWTGR